MLNSLNTRISSQMYSQSVTPSGVESGKSSSSGELNDSPDMDLPTWLNFTGGKVEKAYLLPGNGNWWTPQGTIGGYNKDLPFYWSFTNTYLNGVSIQDSGIKDATLKFGSGADRIDMIEGNKNRFTIDLNEGNDLFFMDKSSPSSLTPNKDNIFVVDGGNGIDTMLFSGTAADPPNISYSLSDFTKIGTETIDGQTYYVFKDSQNNLFKLANFEKVLIGGLEMSFTDFWNQMNLVPPPDDNIVSILPAV